MVDLIKIKILLENLYNLQLSLEKLKKLKNLDELLNCLENEIPIEFKWTLIYKISIYDRSPDAATGYIERNIQKLIFDEKKSYWNPYWQKSL